MLRYHTVASMLVAALTASSSYARAQEDKAPIRIDIVANDYAFMPLPARIAAGATVFTFANRGKVYHEMAIGRLKAGVTMEDLLKVSKAGGRLRDLVARSVGILVAGPGNSPDGRLLVDLLAGDTYVLFCNFKDTPDAQTHMTMGMYATFRPQ